MAEATLTQPLSGIGSVAETNRLLGGNYFDTTPGAKLSTPTIVTNANTMEKTIPDNANKLANISGGATPPPIKDASGNEIGRWNTDANGYIDPKTGSKIQMGGTFNGKTTSNPTETTNTAPGASASSDAWLTYINGGAQATPESVLKSDPILKAEMDLVQGLKNSHDASYNATVSSIKNIYADKISKLERAQGASTASVNQSLALSGSDRYAPISSQGIFDAKTRVDMDALTELQNQEQDLIAKAQSAKDANDEKTVADTLALYDKKHTELINQADKIRTTLQKEKDDIKALALKAKEGGAPDDVVKKIIDSGDYASAISQSGDYLQSATGTLGDYLQYKKDTIGKGLTPTDYTTFKDQQDAKTAKQKSTEAYNTAYGSAAGKADAEAKFGTGTTPTGDGTTTPGGGGITEATGLSIDAFNYMTQGTSALTRMSEGSRARVKNEVNNYLKRTGTDYATFQSQYKAYNEALESNIKRVNLVKVAEGELGGTLQNLSSAADDASFNSMKWNNIVKLWAGQEFNDKNVSKYAFHLNQLRSEIALYNAAAAGKTSTDDADRKEAERIIKEGFAKGSVTGFQEALKSSVDKMDVVLNDNLNRTQKQVWDLFGVGSKYQAPKQQIDPKEKVNEYVKSNPSQAENIAKLYDIPGATDADIYEYINHLNK